VNYLENNNKVPWDDLKYIIGEIMYGGHIVEDWDRRLAFAYLEVYLQNDLLEGMEFFPKFFNPPNTLTQNQVSDAVVTEQAGPPLVSRVSPVDRSPVEGT
jgi:dynein heavy chain